MILELSDFILDESSDFTRLDNVEESFNIMESTYSFLSEINKEYNNISMDLYKSILEANSYEVINESFNSFFDKVKEMFKKFKDFISKLFKKFTDTISGKAKELKNETRDLSKYKDFNGYVEQERWVESLVGDNDIPRTEPMTNLVNELVGDLTSLSETRFKDDKKIKEKIELLTNKLSSKVDEYLGQMVGLNRLTPDNFEDKVSELFYEDSDSVIMIKCFEDIKYIFKEIDNLDKLMHTTARQKQLIIKRYDKMIKEIDYVIDIDKNSNKASISYESDKKDLSLSAKSISELSTYKKKCVESMKLLSEKHTLAFSIKLKYIRDFMTQETDLLKAINKEINNKESEDSDNKE